jgi:hypothetical protein
MPCGKKRKRHKMATHKRAIKWQLTSVRKDLERTDIKRKQDNFLFFF